MAQACGPPIKTSSTLLISFLVSAALIRGVTAGGNTRTRGADTLAR
jgi:hypothetical protein